MKLYGSIEGNNEDYGFIFNYNGRRIGRSRMITEATLVGNLDEMNCNMDNLFVYCKPCRAFMEFYYGDSYLAGKYICKRCGSTVRERTLYRQLDRECEQIEAEMFDDGYDVMPDGCEACGGPWPSCESSCRLIDD